MRTTVRIENELLEELKARAADQEVSLTQVVNQTIRRGLAGGEQQKASAPFVQQTYDMGVPRFDVNKALSVAADLEDEYIMQKLARGQ
jgi:hypothetical protein